MKIAIYISRFSKRHDEKHENLITCNLFSFFYFFDTHCFFDENIDIFVILYLLAQEQHPWPRTRWKLNPDLRNLHAIRPKEPFDFFFYLVFVFIVVVRFGEEDTSVAAWWEEDSCVSRGWTCCCRMVFRKCWPFIEGTDE